jgi:YD repeat-containing protein
MAVLPSEIPTGLVVGQYYFVNADNVDADTDPELTVVTGTVKLACQAKKPLRMPSKKATVVPMQFRGKFDSQGRLVPESGNGIGIEVPASDSNLFNPKDFTWLVEFELKDAATGYTINLEPFPIRVLEGVENDLTLLAPVDSSPGTITIAGPPNVLTIGTVETIGPFDDPVFAPTSGIIYDARGCITSITEDGITTSYTYNANGTVHTETRLGKVRTWTYDASGNSVSSTVA